MSERFIPFALPDIGEEEISEVVDSLRSGWLTSGPKTKRFEMDFAEFIGGGVEAVAVNSATAGLHLALEASGIDPGDQVITTPYTFTATAEVIRYLGADPVFVDIDPLTYNIDPVKVEECITRNAVGEIKNRKKIAAIIPVHFGGLACDMEAISAIAEKHDLKVIEDAAHALPATFGNRLIGTLGSDATVYSFYATKTLTTGEGGMLVTRKREVAERCRTMRLHGINGQTFDRYTAKRPSWSYEVIAPGYKYNLTDVAASMGIHQLKKAWRFQKRRAEIAARYSEAFEDLPLMLPSPPRSGDIHAWHLYVIRINDGIGMDRDIFIEKMFAQGIGCSVHFIPLHLHPYWRDRYGLMADDFPEAIHAYERSVSLPIYTKMTDDEVERVIRTVRHVLT